jgi:LysM repeat protein
MSTAVQAAGAEAPAQGRGPAMRGACLALWLLLALHAPLSSTAQDPRGQGRRYVIHTVEQGQTLFAISRVYAVPLDALLEANPGAEQGLSIGQELRIPQEAIQKKEARTAPTMLKDGELEHTVAKRETLFGISRRYGVDMNALLERNPDANAGLREGMVLVIPMALVEGQRDEVVRPALPEGLQQHTVQPGETLYALGKRYGVAPEVIEAANNGLPEGLKAGDVVLVPVPPDGLPVTEELLPVIVDRTHQIALLLPFSAQRNDSLLAANPHEKKLYEPTRIAAQFYAGARMALDSLEKLGLRAEVSVVDLGDEPRTWSPALRRAELAKVDLFIGPFHRTAIEQLARSNSRAHIVCPVPQTNKLLLGHPTVSKVTPTRPELIRHAGRYVAQRHAMDRIILLRPDLPAEKEAQDQMARALGDALARQSARGPDSVLVARPGRRDMGDLPGKLHAERLNVIVAPSDDVEFVSHLVNKLKPLAGKYRIKVVGLESWQDMSSVAARDLDLLGFMFPAESFTDHGDPNVQAFVHAFRARYGQDVDEYALLGFDVTFFYGLGLLQFGTAFHQHFNELRTEPLHMGFRMTRTGPEHGFRNEYAVMLEQHELQLRKAR